MTEEDAQLDIRLQGFTYQDRDGVLGGLGEAIDMAGGWLLDRRSLSAQAMEMQIELQQRALPEMYGALLSAGLELTRNSHRLLAERCNCVRHLPPRRGMSTVMSLRVEVTFLAQPEPPLDLSRLLLLRTATA